jgi:hypothetical protein
MIFIQVLIFTISIWMAVIAGVIIPLSIAFFAVKIAENVFHKSVR